MAKSRACAILVCTLKALSPDCERSLRELEHRGYVIVYSRGGDQIDLIRSQMASDFLREGFAETMWIDPDIAFSADDVERLRSHNVPISTGLYPQPGKLSIAAKCLPDTPALQFGIAGGLTEILYANCGFLHVRREVYESIRDSLALPECNTFGSALHPYFQPIVGTVAGYQAYLSEGYSFCERARQVGYSIWADTSIRLWRIAPYRFSWEDAAAHPTRYDSFTYELRDPVRFAADGSPE